MITVDKNHVSNLMLIEAYSEKHQTEEKINIFKKKYNKNLYEFELQIQNSEQESFELFDDYMEWKAYENYLKEINMKKFYVIMWLRDYVFKNEEPFHTPLCPSGHGD